MDKEDKKVEDFPSEEKDDKKEKSQVEILEEKIEKLQKERDQFEDKYLRTLAEFENFKKRQKKLFNTMTEQFRDELIVKFVEVLDNFERALAVCPIDDKDGHFEGFKMIAQQIREFLHSENIAPIDNAEESFDPNVHEAIQSVPSEEHPSGKILEVLQKGYKRDDKLIRPARVVVSAGPKKEEE
ncbi:MAG: nucleotide exchange factor GrpE [Candidatus Zixiibacteriota bacterium]